MQIHTLSSHDVVSEILELSELCHREDDVRKVLQLLVDKLAHIMQTDVCSIYLLDSKSKNLILAATKGLNSAAIGQVRMQVGEGLVGKTLEWLKPVSLAKGGQIFLISVGSPFLQPPSHGGSGGSKSEGHPLFAAFGASFDDIGHSRHQRY